MQTFARVRICFLCCSAILKSRDGDVRNEVVNKDDSILLESKPSASPITTGFNMQHTMMPKGFLHFCKGMLYLCLKFVDIAPKSRYNQSKEFKLHENMKVYIYKDNALKVRIFLVSVDSLYC